jgi:hypothetical protein
MLRALASHHPHLAHLSVARLYLGPGVAAEVGSAVAAAAAGGAGPVVHAAGGGGGGGGAIQDRSGLASVQLKRLESLVMSYMVGLTSCVRIWSFGNVPVQHTCKGEATWTDTYIIFHYAIKQFGAPSSVTCILCVLCACRTPGW